MSPRHVLSGGIRVFLAESLIIPSGLLVAAYLARRLGPDGYGVFAIAAALISWIEWSLTALFSRASVRFVAEASDWRPIGATIVTFHLLMAAAATLILMGVAGTVATLLGTPALAGRLRLFAIDIPLFCLAQAHRNILIGLGDFQHRAYAAAARWVSRLLLVMVFVELGWSIDGAILGSIAASAVELACSRAFVKPSFSARVTLQIQKLWGFAAPLLLSGLALRLFDKLDLIALTALGGTTEDAGFYGAAQNLSLLPSIFAASFSPLLISVLTRAYRESRNESATRIGRAAMRWVLLLVPFIGVVAGSAQVIVGVIFGQAFQPAASVLAILLFAAVALLLISVMTAILVAAGRPDLSLAFTGPLPLVAELGYLALIPRAGARGAALVTFMTAALAALALAVTVHRVSRALPIELASGELALGLARGASVVDATVVRAEDAYPVYDSTYRDHLHSLRLFLDPIVNLHTVGRNGMHKYNNQDHSMYAAMLTVANLRGANNDVWEVNTDFEYHESQKVPTNGTRAQPGRPARAALDPQPQFHRPKPSLTA